MVKRIAKLLELFGRHGTKTYFFGGKREIERRKGEPYMTRYYVLSTPWLGIYLHQFWASDFPVHHDHPWFFLSIPIGCGYLEHMVDGTVIDREKNRVALRSANDLHWIQIKKPGTWSVFIRFGASRDWGFLTKDGWVRYDLYDPEIQQLRKAQGHGN